MGILKSNPNGEVRGTVGDVTFSRNRSGQYIKSRYTPPQPGTQAQLDAQAAFFDASAGWMALTDRQRESWEKYAYNPAKFVPSRPRTHGKRQGRCAYISLRMNCYAKNTASTYPEYDTSEFGGTISGTHLSYSPAELPPEANLSGNMGMGAGVAPVKLNLKQLYGYVGAKYIKIQIIGDGRNFILDGTQDEFGNRFGFIVYASKPMPYPGSRPQVDDFMLIGSIKPITQCNAPGFTAVSDFWLYLPWDGIFANYKYPLAAGDIRKFTVYVLSENGLRHRVGSIWYKFIS